MRQAQRQRRTLAIEVSLAVLTLLAYAPVARNSFINLDDPAYITHNPQVQSGLSMDGVRWAFTTGHSANWHPLTWISHMLDCQLWGLSPVGHHLTSLALHIASAVLLFRFFERTTGVVWASAFVAVVHAVHPLHVESVAWAAERKDVLSGLLWILTMIAWVHWVERPSAKRYALVMVLYALGLMAKPMLVTLPLVLLLLDVWPLHRIGLPRPGRADALRVVSEKLPLFALALASSMVTYAVQRASGAMEVGSHYPLAMRAENAVVSYIAYIGKALWPARLAVFYPLTGSAIPVGRVLGSAVILVSLSILALGLARTRPYLAVGWLWYLGTLFPVIGIIQVGAQAMADRYTYLPLIGLSIVVAWSGADVATRWPRVKLALAVAACVTVSVWIVATARLAACWRNDVDLFSHEVESLPHSARAHVMLGNVLMGVGRLDDATAEYRRALDIGPDDAEARINLARSLARLGEQGAAAQQLREVLRVAPDSATAHFLLAGLLADQGDFDDASQHYRETLRLQPGWAEAHNNYGSLLLHHGDRDAAIAQFTRALELDPNMSAARHNLRLAGR